MVKIVLERSGVDASISWNDARTVIVAIED